MRVKDERQHMAYVYLRVASEFSQRNQRGVTLFWKIINFLVHSVQQARVSEFFFNSIRDSIAHKAA